MKIIKAKKEDVKDIVNIEYTCGNKELYGYKSKKFVENMFKKYFKKDKFFVLKQNKKILGYMALNKSKKKGELDFIAISKKHQGKGLGSKLIAFAEKYFKKIGCNKIHLGLFAKNFKAITLYTQHKFYVIKSYKRHNRPRIEMQKDL